MLFANDCFRQDLQESGELKKRSALIKDIIACFLKKRNWLIFQANMQKKSRVQGHKRLKEDSILNSKW